MARENDVSNLQPQIVTVPVGVTVGVFVGPVAGQASVLVENLTSGATLFLMQSNVGSTMPGATLAALFATFAYAVPTAPNTVNIEGPASFYLAATGATATVHLLRKLTSGF